MFKGISSRNYLVVLWAGALAFSLTACGSPAVMLPPSADFYVLDLSDSGKAEDQFERISEDVLRSLTRNSLGQPFSKDGEAPFGPRVTTFSFVGNNSRFLKTFQLQDFEKVSQLYDIVKEDPRAQNSWDKLTTTYQDLVEPQLSSPQSNVFTSSSCKESFDAELKDYFSGEATRSDLVDKLCQMATYTVSRYIELAKYIQFEKNRHTMSDVFGAIESVNSSVESIKEKNPESIIRLSLATDGENFVGSGSALNMSSILAGKDACVAGREVFNRLSAKSLRGIDVELPGIGALLGNKAEYASQIDKFWRCFFNV
jgi:hypothetical protein